MRIADTVSDSIVDGTGLRFVVFTQGCPHLCEGCHNTHTHDFDGGTDVTTDELFKKIETNPLCDGLTLSGGEPFSQAAECAELAKRVKEHGLNVWTYSGWTLETLTSDTPPAENCAELLKYTDVLIDGRFELSKRTLALKWRGSSNQRVWEQFASGEWRLKDI